MFRDEGKVSRKLIECVNTYLLKDGPNLGCDSWKIHEALRESVFRYWLSSHDRNLKVFYLWSMSDPPLPPILFSLQINSIGCMFLQVAFFTYTRLQLSLTRETAAVSSLVEQLVDVIFKELDQSSMTSSGSLR